MARSRLIMYALALGSAAAGLVSMHAAHAETLARAEQVKAVFIYNFASFVSWPDSAFSAPSSPMLFCTTGKGESARALRSALRGERVGQRPVEYRYVDPTDDHRACHVLYLKGLDRVSTEAALGRLDGAPVLTVSDDRSFAEGGGMVELATQRNRIHPIINLKATRSAGLKPSSKLLRLCTVIDD